MFRGIAFCGVDPRRMKTAIGHRTVKRERPALRRDKVAKIAKLADKQGDATAAAFYSLAYSFLLRVQSELVPVTLKDDSLPLDADADDKAVLTVSENKAVLTLKTRKNAREPTVHVRNCWCKNCPALCPVHRTLELLERYGHGSSPFRLRPISAVIKTFRSRLAEAAIKEWYTLHSFRRGHATDLAESGAPLSEILRAGGWSSAAFTAYLNMQKVGEEAITQTIDAVHEIVSDSENEG